MLLPIPATPDPNKASQPPQANEQSQLPSSSPPASSKSTTITSASLSGPQVTSSPHSPELQRLSKPPLNRVVLTGLASGAAGFALGVLHESQVSALRFRAENSHRLPKSQKGWYLYHKSKSYAVLKASTVEGVKMGLKLGVWSAVFVAAEEAIDRGRLRLSGAWEGRQVRDFVSTAVAGTATAGAFGGWYQLPWHTTARMIRVGALGGLCFGLVQDAVTLLQGHELSYVNYVKRAGRYVLGRGGTSDS